MQPESIITRLFLKILAIIKLRILSRSLAPTTALRFIDPGTNGEVHGRVGYVLVVDFGAVDRVHAEGHLGISDWGGGGGDAVGVAAWAGLGDDFEVPYEWQDADGGWVRVVGLGCWDCGCEAEEKCHCGQEAHVCDGVCGLVWHVRE